MASLKGPCVGELLAEEIPEPAAAATLSLWPQKPRQLGVDITSPADMGDGSEQRGWRLALTRLPLGEHPRHPDRRSLVKGSILPGWRDEGGRERCPDTTRPSHRPRSVGSAASQALAMWHLPAGRRQPLPQLTVQAHLGSEGSAQGLPLPTWGQTPQQSAGRGRNGESGPCSCDASEKSHHSNDGLHVSPPKSQYMRGPGDRRTHGRPPRDGNKRSSPVSEHTRSVLPPADTLPPGP